MNKKNDEAVKKVAKILYEQAIEREKNETFSPKSIFPELKKSIRDLGLKFEITDQIKELCKTNPELTRDTILKLYKKAEFINEKQFLISSLMTKENHVLIPYFYDELKNCSEENRMLQIHIGGFFLFTANKNYKEYYRKILLDDSISILQEPFTDVRCYIITAINKFKYEDFKPIYIKLLDNRQLTMDCIKALDKYRDESLRPIFEKYIDDENKYIKKYAIKSIEHLDKKKNK